MITRAFVTIIPYHITTPHSRISLTVTGHLPQSFGKKHQTRQHTLSIHIHIPTILSQPSISPHHAKPSHATQTMPVLHPNPNLHLPPPQQRTFNNSLLYILLTLFAILLLETFLVLGYLRYHNLASKKRWRELRERGEVLVDGPVMVWAEDLPPRRTVSRVDLGRLV